MHRTLRQGCCLYCIAPELMDIADKEKGWASLIFKVEKSLQIIPINSKRKFLNFTQVAIKTVLQYLFLRGENEKVHLWSYTTSVIWWPGPSMSICLYVCSCRTAGWESWSSDSESKFGQIIVSTGKSQKLTQVNPEEEGWNGNQCSPAPPTAKQSWESLDGWGD